MYIYIYVYMEGAMRRDTAAPSICWARRFVIRFGMWRMAVYAWRFMLDDRLVDLV